MNEQARFPLPGFLFALLALAVVHGPLLAVPPLFDEAPFLAGFSESRGAVLGMQWLPVELALLGDGARAHRAFALALEIGMVLLVALAPTIRRSRAPNLALVAIAAWLAHPWRTESVVRLGARAVVVSELLLLAGVLVMVQARRRALVAAGAVLVLLGTSGMPLAVALAIPWTWCARPLDAEGSRAGRSLVFAAALVAGVAAWWFAAPPAARLGSALAGLDLLARPWSTGLVHFGAEGSRAAIGGALLLLLFVLGMVRRDAAVRAAIVAAALAFAAAPALRPPRTGLEMAGVGLTPEAWLVPLTLVTFAAWRLADDRAWTRLPLLAFAGLAIGSGLVHAHRFDDEAKLLDHAIAVAPAAVELQVVQSERMLRQVGFAPPERQREQAALALQEARRALARRPQDVAAATLELLAIALLGKLDEARERSDRLFELHPEDWRARAARAELESLAGDDLAALTWLRAAVDAQPSPLLRARYAGLLDRIYEQIRVDLAERRFETARARCERLAAIAPEEIEARTTYVDTFLLAGDLPRALAEARRLYGERPHDRAIVQRLASLYQQLGQLDEARDFERQLRALPEVPRTRRP